jgi:hypothetical protein
VPSGTIDINTPGVYENVHVTGGIGIHTSNVTIRNFIVDGDVDQNGSPDARYCVQTDNGLSNIVIEDGEIKNCQSASIYGRGFTARRLHMHNNNGDALKPQKAAADDTIIEDCFIEKLGQSEGSHADGVQIDNGGPHNGYNVIIRRTNIWMPYPGTPPAPTWPGGIYRSNAAGIFDNSASGVIIEDSWLCGGNITVYTHDDTIVRDNVFCRYNAGWPDITKIEAKAQGGGPCGLWEGNTWEDDGSPAESSCDQ